MRVLSEIRRFQPEDKAALSVLGVVSAVGFVGALMAAVIAPSYLRPFFIFIAVVTFAGGSWLSYYSIYGTHRLRFALSDTNAELDRAHELIRKVDAAESDLRTSLVDSKAVVADSRMAIEGLAKLVIRVSSDIVAVDQRHRELAEKQELDALDARWRDWLQTPPGQAQFLLSSKDPSVQFPSREWYRQNVEEPVIRASQANVQARGMSDDPPEEVEEELYGQSRSAGDD